MVLCHAGPDLVQAGRLYFSSKREGGAAGMNKREMLRVCDANRVSCTPHTISLTRTQTKQDSGRHTQLFAQTHDYVQKKCRVDPVLHAY